MRLGPCRRLDQFFCLHARNQVANKTYSLDANLALLRFYQINPQSTKLGLVAKVLLKAIMQLPNPDFKACGHVLSEKVQVSDAESHCERVRVRSSAGIAGITPPLGPCMQSDETVAKVMQLASALETTRFTDFWTLASSCKDLLASSALQCSGGAKEIRAAQDAQHEAHLVQPPAGMRSDRTVERDASGGPAGC